MTSRPIVQGINLRDKIAVFRRSELLADDRLAGVDCSRRLLGENSDFLSREPRLQQHYDLLFLVIEHARVSVDKFSVETVLQVVNHRVKILPVDKRLYG